MKTKKAFLLVSVVLAFLGVGTAIAEVAPSSLLGRWWGFYRDVTTGYDSVFDLTLYSPDENNHFQGHWRMWDENYVPFKHGVVEGDLTKKTLTLFDLDPSPVRFHFIQVLFDKSLNDIVLMGRYQQQQEVSSEDKDKKVTTLGYYMVYRDQ